MPVSNHTNVAAFFDIDNTLLRGASLYHFGRGAVKHGYITGRDLWSFALQQARFIRFGENTAALADIRDRALQLVANHSSAELKQMAGPMFETYLRPRVYQQAVAKIQDHQRQGHETWVVSATPVEVSGEFVTAYNLTGALGTIAETVDDLYTGGIEGSFLHGPEKALAVTTLAAERDLDLSQCFAYSDSINDIPLLEAVGNPVAANPDRKLAAEAKKRGWPIIRFNK